MLLGLQFVPTTSYANTNLVCVDCNSIEMRNKAISNGNGPVHVFDYTTGVVKRYEVIIENEFGFQMATAAPLVASASIVNTVDTISRAYIEILLFNNDTVDIPSYIASSAYDLSGHVQVQNNVIDFINQNMSLRQKAVAFTGNLLELVPNAPDLKIQMKFKFDDDSEIDVELDSDTVNYNPGDPSFLFKVESAKDSDNNPIPLNGSDFDGRSDFPEGDNNSNVGGFERAASNNSVVINIPPGGVSSGGSGWIVTITCSKTNGVTTCTKRYVRSK